MPPRAPPDSSADSGRNGTGTEQRVPGLWTFVPLTEYQRPSMPVRGAAAQAWSSVTRFFAKDADGNDAAATPEADLRALSELQLEHLVAPIRWAEAARALGAALADRAAAAAAETGVVFVIGQPHGGHGEMVEAWAAEHQARCLSAPSLEQILADDAAWPGVWPEAQHRWALPRLEHCFLRHTDGLALVRRLFERIVGDEAGNAVIGCDSWAWAYLQHVWPVSGAQVLTLQAFDAPRLSRLFADLAQPRPPGRLWFRNPDSGKVAMAVPDEDGEVGDELVRLAAHCRGNVGTARNYWRQRLRATREIEGEAADKAPIEPVDEVVWVSAAKNESMPAVDNDEEVALLLHAVLLHGGLSDQALVEVLPLSKHRCTAIVRRLQQLSLLEQHQGRWSVAPLAYAMVREWVSKHDLLRDVF